MTGGDDVQPPKGPRYEPFSAYYLHPSEGTGAVISPIMLKGDNYEEWSRSLRNNLRAKNKLGFIDGTIKVSDAKSPDFDQWGIVNSMLVAWIVNTLDVSVRSTVRFPDHVKSLWDDLRDRYSLGNGPHILELKAQIVDCKQRGRPVAVYFGELHKLQDELASYVKIPKCTCTAAPEYAKIVESELLHQIFIGLDPKKFGSVVSTLLMMDPIPSLNVAYAKVLSDERKQTVSDVTIIVQMVLLGLLRLGHVKEKCFDLHGWPESFNSSGQRGGRGSSRGGRGGCAQGSSGRVFAGSVSSSSKQNNGDDINNVDRTSAPTLSNEQWAQFMSATKGVKTPPSTDNNSHVSQLLEKQKYIVLFTNKLCTIQVRTLENLIGAGVQYNGVYLFRPVRARSFQVNSLVVKMQVCYGIGV
ncbi:uncharacterized protein LOC110719238 [Chenopodium quinoa]|uniref:uncharacterized protein LOC110719238 n=1 Tax=Chenopodium quinoa TaxID=63459 RepID=UPI000B78074A|nr:uncharacterized protein LOC110719238 [Chenopodium quinoa]